VGLPNKPKKGTAPKQPSNIEQHHHTDSARIGANEVEWTKSKLSATDVERVRDVAISKERPNHGADKSEPATIGKA
jgi:hypothetical protein